ncbi:Tn7 transposase TnsA N-terminal domain-containing protein, partial [Defluviimonas salinarum]
MFDDDRPAPARVIHALGLQKKVNLLSGTKMSGVNQLESMLESNVAIAAEVDPRVIKIECQPVTFDLNTGREYAAKQDLVSTGHDRGYKPWVYTPDFRFTLRDGSTIFVEGKGTRWLGRHEDFPQVIAAVRGLGHRIEMVTEGLFPDTLVRNLRLLKPHVGSTECMPEWSREPVAADHPLPARRLLEATSLTQRHLFLGLLRGIFSCDLAVVPLGPKALIHFGNGDCQRRRKNRPRGGAKLGQLSVHVVECGERVAPRQTRSSH